MRGFLIGFALCHACRNFLCCTAAPPVFMRPGAPGTAFVLAMVALTAISAVGLNILVGLTWPDFAWPCRFSLCDPDPHGGDPAFEASASGSRCRLPGPDRQPANRPSVVRCPRAGQRSPYSCLVTIAFCFNSSAHLSIEWAWAHRAGQTGRLKFGGLLPPVDRVLSSPSEREWRCWRSRAIAGASIFLYLPAGENRLGQGHGSRLRDADVAAAPRIPAPQCWSSRPGRGLPLLVGSVNNAACAVGTVRLPCWAFVATGIRFSVSRSRSCFLFSCRVGGAGWCLARR